MRLKIFIILLLSFGFAQDVSTQWEEWDWWGKVKNTGTVYTDLNTNDGTRPFTAFNGPTYLTFDGVNDYAMTSNINWTNFKNSTTDSIYLEWTMKIYHETFVRQQFIMGKFYQSPNAGWVLWYDEPGTGTNAVGFYMLNSPYPAKCIIAVTPDTGVFHRYRVWVNNVAHTLVAMKDDSITANHAGWTWTDATAATNFGIGMMNLNQSAVPGPIGSWNYFKGSIYGIIIKHWNDGTDSTLAYPCSEGLGSFLYDTANGNDTLHDRTYPGSVAYGLTHLQIGLKPTFRPTNPYAPKWVHGTAKGTSYYSPLINLTMRNPNLYPPSDTLNQEAYQLGMAVIGDTIYSAGVNTDTAGGFKNILHINKIFRQGGIWKDNSMDVGIDKLVVQIFATQTTANSLLSNRVFAGGDFTFNGDSSLTLNQNGQFYNGAWDTMSTGGIASYCYLMNAANDTLLIGTSVGTRVYGWNGVNFTAMGDLSAKTTGIWSLCYFNSELYVGGVNGLYKWNGAAWDSVAGPNGYIFTMQVFNNHLVIGGSFTTIGGITSNGICKYNGSTFSAINNGIGITGLAQSVIEMTLTTGAAGEYVAVNGDFYSADTLECGNLCLIKTQNGNRLYVTGSFWSMNGIVCRMIFSLDENWNVYQEGYGFPERTEDIKRVIIP
jgi:hypothetical protein